jgi:signal transduction histidine kinase
VKTYSIIRRLIVTVLLIELVAAVCVTGVALLYERHAHFRAFDVLLRGRADSMLGAVQDAEDANDNVMLDGTEVTVPADDVYQVIDAGGHILGRSANWTELKASDESNRGKREATRVGDEYYFQAKINDHTYRVIRMQGLRIVDPGDKGGGIRRYVTVYYGSSVRRVWGAVLRAVGFYAISSLLVLACTGILMSWLLNRGLAPLRELAMSASNISATSWSFLPPDNAREARELAPLVTVLEGVLNGLERSFAQQRRFVGDAAHELKTSVAVIKSSLQLLGMKERSAEEYRTGLERCLTDSARMEGIVAQMLHLARIEESEGHDSTPPQSALLSCLQEVVQELETISKARGVPILIEGDRTLLVSVDAEQLKLLCTNLLLNAIQHSPPNFAITVMIRREGAFAEMTFSDYGDGIAPEDLPHIFERFWRGDPSRSRKTGGTGLGLAICKAIVDKFDGEISIESSLNNGTKAVVRFPIVDSPQVSS